MTTRRSAALLPLWIALTCLLAATAPTGRAQSFVDSTTVVVVEIPVHVVRDGEPVRGLSRDDFELLDGRKPQKIVGFDVIDLSQTVPMAPSLEALADRGEPRLAPTSLPPITARRHFLMLFDLSFSAPTAVGEAQAAARDLLEGGLHPSDVVAVATYSETQGVSLLQGFSPDREQTRLAIDTLGLPQLVRRAQDPLALVFGNLQGAQSLPQGSGRAANAITEALKDMSRRMEQSNRQIQQQQVATFMRSFTELARLMKSTRGRKHVVWLSEGFDTSLLFGTTDQETQNRMNTAVEDGRVWEVDSEQRYGNTRNQNALEAMLEEFRRSDCTFQTVDIGGLRSRTDVAQGSSRDRERSRANLTAREDGLALMASNTGGEWVRNFNNLSEALGEVLDRTSVTYVLAYQPEKLAHDGKYHRLKVKLKGAPKGTRVVHRPGFYAPRPYAESDLAERRLLTAELIVGGRDGGTVEGDLLATPVPSATPRVYVPMFLEIDGESLSATSAEDILQTEVYAYAMGAEGGIRDYFNHTLNLDLSSARQMIEQTGIKFYGHFDLEPGDYHLRVMVRNLQTGHYGLRTLDLTVPDFAADPVLLRPFFVESPGRWMMAREDLAPGEQQPAFPFMMRGQPFLPAARPVLTKGELVDVNLMAYNLGGADLELSSRITASGGHELTEPALQLVGNTTPDTPGVAKLAATFEAGKLAPGDYTLTVRVRDPASGKEASSSAPFAVVKR